MKARTDREKIKSELADIKSCLTRLEALLAGGASVPIPNQTPLSSSPRLPSENHC